MMNPNRNTLLSRRLSSRLSHMVVAAFMLLAITEPAITRDWQWYPKRQSSDANALRPDWEGSRGDDGSSGMSELDEMRRWLYQREVERRERGFTVPDVVEQGEPGRDGSEAPVSRAPVTPPGSAWTRPIPQVPRTNWPQSGPAQSAGAFDGGTRDRVHDSLPAPGKDLEASQDEVVIDPSASEEPEYSNGPAQRHARTGKHRRHGKSYRHSRSHSGKSAKTQKSKRRRH